MRSAYARRAAFERLEDRWVLSPVLAPFATQAAAAGTAALVAPAGGTATAPTVTHTPAGGIGTIASYRRSSVGCETYDPVHLSY